ncbi:hypothetical protein KP509_22G025500 [Ceratopteris richardii]|uniref:RING-type domain-containing protein n=1 Tax=Ceratopteris richardii TaxID=49495 RepID=A0A8T2S6P2_CERRI|nr:hypothetical protein KP509_22G025500 [Ceratopteris richardii]
MTLPGVESARRRRVSHGRAAALMEPHPRLAKTSPFSFVGADKESVQRLYPRSIDGVQVRVIAARKRLDEKLRAGGFAAVKGTDRCAQTGEGHSHMRIECVAESTSFYGFLGKTSASASARPSSRCLPVRCFVSWAACFRGIIPRKREQASSLGMEAWSLHVQEECPVCLESLHPEQNLIHLPCSHVFHVSCLLPWLQDHSHCPLCRAPTPTEQGSLSRSHFLSFPLSVSSEAVFLV